MVIAVLYLFSCSRDQRPTVLMQFNDCSISPEPFGEGGKEVTVLVYGEVKKPGVYRLFRGARKLNAIEKAGGLTEISDLTGLKLFAPVEPGEIIFVPARLSE